MNYSLELHVAYTELHDTISRAFLLECNRDNTFDRNTICSFGGNIVSRVRILVGE